MDSADFEFVKADEADKGAAVNIKHEPLDELLTPDVKLFEGGSSSDVGKSKCGEIFTINQGYFILICAFCNAEFENMRTFGVHMRNKHDGGSSTGSSAPPTLTALPAAQTTKSHQQKLELEVHNRTDMFTNILGTEAANLETELTVGDDEEMVNLLSVSTFKKDVDDRISENEDDVGVDLDDGDDGSFHLSSGASSESSDEDENYKPGKEDNQSFKCESCNKRYKSKKSLQRHQKTAGCKQSAKPVDPSLFCVQCNRQLKTRATFLKHVKAHENRNKKDEGDNSTCEDGSPSKSKAEPPVQDPSLFCEFCNRYFKTRSNLRTHAERHDTIPIALQGDPDFLKCKFCDEPCTDYTARKQHETTHTGDHPYICRVCQKTFATIYKKNVHVALHTGERPHQCPECPNSYLTKRDVLRHVTYRHLNVRRFKCDFCDKSCFRKTELAIHMRRHTGEKPYVCEDCGNSFAALSQLKSHQLRHTQTKNFKCDQCGRFFYSSTSLKDHQASHSDEKPFGCDVCGRRFPRAKALKKHKKLHSDVKAYVCNICGKAYAQDSGLYAHKKSHGLFSNPQGTQFTVPLT